MACAMTFGDLPDVSEFEGCPKPMGKIMTVRRKSSKSWMKGAQYSPAHNSQLHSKLIPTWGTGAWSVGSTWEGGWCLRPHTRIRVEGTWSTWRREAESCPQIVHLLPRNLSEGGRGLGSVGGQDRSGLSQHKEELSGKNRRLGDLRKESSYKQATGTVSVTGSPSQSKQASLGGTFQSLPYSHVSET